MITPEEIRAKARRLYPLAVAAWLRGEEIFPRAVPVNLRPSPVFSEALAEQQAILAHSKQTLGFGYSVERQTIRSRRHATQEFAVAITLDTREDLLRLIGKRREFHRLTEAVNLIREREPDLSKWVVSKANWRRLLEVYDDLQQLLDVVVYLKAHPRPGCFIRELPLAISTKLVEQHASILSQWLDMLIPHHVDVDFSWKQFAQRYGFRSAEDHLWLRILDEQMLDELRCPGSELTVPHGTLEALPVRDARVIIVENKINLLTLPALRRTIGLGGLGNAVTQLFNVSWIKQLPVTYWGDLDVEGLRILARLRRHWPQAQSMMMDSATLADLAELVIRGNPHDENALPPDELTEEERAAFIRCRDESLRLEQERIPQWIVNERLSINSYR